MITMALEGVGAVAGEADVMRSRVETMVAELWEGVLGGGPGVDENFFAAGGDSLKATLFVARVSSAFDVEMRLRDFFAAPTAESVVAFVLGAGVAVTAVPTSARAARVDDRAARAFESRVPVDGPSSRTALLPSQNQRFRLDAMYRDSERARSRRMPPVRGLISSRYSVDSPMDVARLSDALERLVARQAVLRSRFHLVDDRWQVSIASPVRPEVVSVSHLPTGWNLTPFGLEEGCWLKVFLVPEGSRTELAVLTDHLVWDSVSERIFIDQLWRDYHGEEVPAGMDYYDWTRVEESHASGDIRRRLETYWRSVFEEFGFTPQFPLTSQISREAHQPGTADVPITRVIADIGSRQDLLRVLPERGSNLSGWALALWFSAVFEMHRGLDASVVNFPCSNRDADTIETIGWFANNVRIHYTRADHQLPMDGRVELLSERVVLAMENAVLPMNVVVPDLDRMSEVRPLRVFANMDLPPSSSAGGTGFVPLHDDDTDGWSGAIGGAYLSLGAIDDRVRLEVEVDSDLIAPEQARLLRAHLQHLALHRVGTSGGVR